MSKFTLTADNLEKLFELNCYVIPDDINLVFVGIRGALADDPDDNSFKDTFDLNTRVVDYNAINCTIVQWQRAEKKIAAFPASTVPNRFNILGYKDTPPKNSNCLCPGFYKFYHRGKHRPKNTQNWHDAFRQDGQALTIRRTFNNTTYDNFDTIDISTGCDDNIHAAWTMSTDGGYSSAGCQVVMGIPFCEHTKAMQNDNRAPWKTFKANGYAASQENFPYALFTSAEVFSLCQKIGSGAQVAKKLKFGSSGPEVTSVQQALIGLNYLSGTADGDFGKNTFTAIKKYQLENFGLQFTDGIVGPVTAQGLALAMPVVAL